MPYLCKSVKRRNRCIKITAVKQEQGISKYPEFPPNRERRLDKSKEYHHKKDEYPKSQK